jgi:hypothetical protein
MIADAPTQRQKVYKTLFEQELTFKLFGVMRYNETPNSGDLVRVLTHLGYTSGRTINASAMLSKVWGFRLTSADFFEMYSEWKKEQ